MCTCHLHGVWMTFVCCLHVIHTSKTGMSCLISCSTTPGDMNRLNLFWIFEYLTGGPFAGSLGADFPDVEKLIGFL